MALQIWMPLNGDVTNKGVKMITSSVASGITYSSDGKIGKCLSASSNAAVTLTVSDLSDMLANGKTYSLACWVKITNNVTSGWVIQLGTNTCGLWWAKSAPRWVWNENDGGKRCANETISNDANWHFLTITVDKTVTNYITTKQYVDGALDTVYPGTTWDCSSQAQPTGDTITLSPYVAMLNDVRLYDHILSVKEIKELAKAKVVHYPFNDNSIQQMTNVFSYPTFNTSSAAGGWSHWGGTGHDGSYGQNTDKQYIFNKGNTYSHWVANGSTATVTYWLYQNKAYDGYRSACFIIKEENSLPITDDIVYPTWNSGAGGYATGSKWTSIQSLGAGFYLCKVEGFKQLSTDNTYQFGPRVKAGYKIYVSEAYLENGTAACSDIWSYTNRVLDCTGNSYNGTTSGSMTVTSNTPRNLYATTFNGTSDSIAITSPFESSVKNPEMTFAFWINRNEYSDGTQRMIYNGICQLYLYTDYTFRITWTHAKVDGSAKNTWSCGSLLVPAGEWHHICLTFKDGYLRCYYDGTQYSYSDRTTTGQFMGGAYSTTQSIGYSQFGGSLSDFRIYATALSADDVKALYNTPVSVANNGVVLTQGEFVEQ